MAEKNEDIRVEGMIYSTLEIDLDEFCVGKVLLDGKDIANEIMGLKIICNAGDVPKVTIRTMHSKLKVKLKGKIKVE